MAVMGDSQIPRYAVRFVQRRLWCRINSHVLLARCSYVFAIVHSGSRRLLLTIAAQSRGYAVKLRSAQKEAQNGALDIAARGLIGSAYEVSALEFICVCCRPPCHASHPDGRFAGRSRYRDDKSIMAMPLMAHSGGVRKKVQVALSMPA